MRITQDQVRYVADLANLKLTEDEVSRFSVDLDEILTYVEKLNEIDTSEVEPMAQVLYEAGDTGTLRADEPRPGFSSEAATANAPLHGAGYFKVPRVIEK